jgi:6,7-dimethyl-8-ribityllumazine synthase
MSSKEKNLSEYKVSEVGDMSDKKFGIIVSEWNDDITSALKEACVNTLTDHQVDPSNIHVAYVPGTYELPLGAKMVLTQHSPDAVICIGCVIKGETEHDRYINQAVAGGIMNLNLVSGKPIIFGVLTPNTKEQALDRAGGKYGNKGVEAAVTAMRMLGLEVAVKGGKKKIGFGK